MSTRSHQLRWKLFFNWFPMIKVGRTNDRQIRLFSNRTANKPCKWLGELLADFYRVELRSRLVQP